jgi:hypothetical protein
MKRIVYEIWTMPKEDKATNSAGKPRLLIMDEDKKEMEELLQELINNNPKNQYWLERKEE